MSDAKFIKFLFNTALNGRSIAKYEPPENYAVMLRVEAENPDKTIGFETKLFRTHDAYENWIDSVVDDQTAIYNSARAVKLTLDAMRAEPSSYPGEDSGIYGE